MSKVFRFINIETEEVREYGSKKIGCNKLKLNLRVIDLTKGSYRIEYNKLSEIEKDTRANPRDQHNGWYLEVVEDNDEEIKKPKMSLLIGDQHFCYDDKDCTNIVYQFCEDKKDYISEVILGGDAVDADGLGKYVCLEKDKFTIYQEMLAFEEYCDNIKRILPNAKFTILEDNHYHLRKQRFLAENPAFKDLLKDVDFEFNEIAKHGDPYFPFSEYGNNKIGGIHGVYCMDNFTKKNTTCYPHDLFQFHTHTTQMYTGVNGLTSYGIPCLCKLDMAYLQGRRSRWVNGFATLTWFEEANNYSMDYCTIKNGIGTYRDQQYKSTLLK